MKAHVNELLFYSRLPFHFWSEVKGGQWPFDNPGCSVLSLCASKLSQQVITVPDEVISCIDDCKHFTITGIFDVMKWVEVTTEELVNKASALAQSKAVFQELTQLLSGITNLRNMFAMSFSGVTPPTALDVSQDLNIMLLQSLIDVKSDIERLHAAIINATSAPSPTKA